MFPAREVVQPTVVDPQSFLVWKARRSQLLSEAFALARHKSLLSCQTLDLDLSHVSWCAECAGSVPFVFFYMK